jgi:hypothetical protein
MRGRLPVPKMHYEGVPPVPGLPTVPEVDSFAERLNATLRAATAVDVLSHYASAELQKLYALENQLTCVREQSAAGALLDALPLAAEAPFPSLRPTFEYAARSAGATELAGTTSSLVHIAQSWGGASVLLASLNAAVHVRWEGFDAGRAPDVIALPGPPAFSRASAFHPSDRLLALTKYGAVTLYDAAQGRAVGGLAPHARTITGAHFASDGRTLVTAGMDARIATHDLIASRAVYDVTLPAYPSALAAADDGAVVGAALASGDVALFDARDDRAAATIEAHSGYATALAFSPRAFRPAASFLATAGSDRALNLFDIRETRQAYAKFHRHLETPLAVAFDDRGNVWSGTRGGELQAWCWADGNCMFRDYQAGAPIYSVAFAERRRSILYTTMPPCFCERRLDALTLAPVRAQPVQAAHFGK